MKWMGIVAIFALRTKTAHGTKQFSGRNQSNEKHADHRWNSEAIDALYAVTNVLEPLVV